MVVLGGINSKTTFSDTHLSYRNQIDITKFFAVNPKEVRPAPIVDRSVIVGPSRNTASVEHHASVPVTPSLYLNSLEAVAPTDHQVVRLYISERLENFPAVRNAFEQYSSFRCVSDSFGVHAGITGFEPVIS